MKTIDLCQRYDPKGLYSSSQRCNGDVFEIIYNLAVAGEDKNDSIPLKTEVCQVHLGEFVNLAQSNTYALEIVSQNRIGSIREREQRGGGSLEVEV